MTTIRSALDVAARAEIAHRTEAIFRSSGALREGHFVLASGLHSRIHLEGLVVIQDTAAASDLCGSWAAAHRTRDRVATIDAVVGPTIAGAMLAFETARQLGIHAVVAVEVGGIDGAIHRGFRAGTSIATGARVIVVDDILSTGGRLHATVMAVESLGAEVVDCHVLVDRSVGTTTLRSSATRRTYPLSALWVPELPTHQPGPQTCPGCAAGEPISVHHPREYAGGTP